MRSTLIAALIAVAVPQAAAHAYDETDPNGSAGPAPPAVPDFTPQPGQQRPTLPPEAFFYSHAFTMTYGEPGASDTDGRVDAMLGVLPQDSADREPVYYFFETEDGKQGCVRLDTMVPEPC